MHRRCFTDDLKASFVIKQGKQGTITLEGDLSSYLAPGTFDGGINTSHFFAGDIGWGWHCSIVHRCKYILAFLEQSKFSIGSSELKSDDVFEYIAPLREEVPDVEFLLAVELILLSFKEKKILWILGKNDLPDC
jgi:hypothetical protein